MTDYPRQKVSPDLCADAGRRKMISELAVKMYPLLEKYLFSPVIGHAVC